MRRHFFQRLSRRVVVLPIESIKSDKSQSKPRLIEANTRLRFEIGFWTWAEYQTGGQNQSNVFSPPTKSGKVVGEWMGG